MLLPKILMEYLGYTKWKSSCFLMLCRACNAFSDSYWRAIVNFPFEVNLFPTQQYAFVIQTLLSTRKKFGCAEFVLVIFWNITIFVFLKLICIIHLLHQLLNWCKHLWRPNVDRDNITRLSAYIIQLSFVPFGSMKGSDSTLSKGVATSLM